jgi:hypothetical protein
VDKFGEKLKSELVVDIVVTVPVVGQVYLFFNSFPADCLSQKWSYRAKNSTLRAVRNAGFNEKSFPGLRDMIMTTEPEAAAIYTARHLKEEEGDNFMKVRILII